jgi:hypothetical protein
MSLPDRLGNFFEYRFDLAFQEVFGLDNVVLEHFQTIRHIWTRIIVCCEAREFSDDASTFLNVGGLLIGKFAEEGSIPWINEMVCEIMDSDICQTCSMFKKASDLQVIIPLMHFTL